MKCCFVLSMIILSADASVISDSLKHGVYLGT